MALPDYSRAYVSLLTSGEEGASPYLSSDLLKVLLGRHQRVRLLHIQRIPLRLDFEIDGARVTVHAASEQEQTEEGIFFYAATPAAKGVIRFNALKSVEGSPTGVVSGGRVLNHIGPLQQDWLRFWPTRSMTCDQFVTNHFGTEAEITYGCTHYLSELLFADAIGMALVSRSW